MCYDKNRCPIVLRKIGGGKNENMAKIRLLFMSW
jgi:hypothetical protein